MNYTDSPTQPGSFEVIQALLADIPMKMNNDESRIVGVYLDQSAEIADKLMKAPTFAVLTFVLSVAEMRATQKAYFRSKPKDQHLLIRSKELEALVDKELAELLK